MKTYEIKATHEVMENAADCDVVKKGKFNLLYFLGQLFGTVCVACVSSLVIGITVKILRWMLF